MSIHDMFCDPLFYINWGSACIAILVVGHYGPILNKIDPGKHFWRWVATFAYLSFVVGILLHISIRAGDIQLLKAGIGK